MYVLDRAQPPVDSVPGIVHRTFAGEAEGLRHLSVWQQTMAPGAATPPHHHGCEEVVLVTRGRGEVLIGGAVLPVAAGQISEITPDLDHQVFHTGDEPLDTTAVFSPTPVPVARPDSTPLALPLAQLTPHDARAAGRFTCSSRDRPRQC